MVEVRRSTIVDAPVDQVWAVLRDFNGHERWHPAVAESRIEEGRAGDEPGCVRRFKLKDGAELREQLLRHSDRERSFSYCIIDSPIPLIDYVSTVTLKPVTDGDRTFWEWSSSFAAPQGREADLAELVGENIYEAGFGAVQAMFGQQVRHGATVPRTRTMATPADARPLDGGAVVVERFGGPEVLRWERSTAMPPGPGEVRLRHTAIGLNYIDVYTRTGYYPLIAPPGVPGMEAAGIVLDVGPGVHGLMPGDRVAYACAPCGAYAEVRTMNADLVVPLPDHVSDRLAAAVMLKGMSAEFLLHRVHAVREGDTILVHAAAGGVGQLVCQWARQIGATVIGTVGSAEKARIARAAGCAYPILYAETDFVDRVMEITEGRGCDVVYDAVGADTFMKSYEALAVRGHLVSFGQASGPIPQIDLAGFVQKSATVSRPNFGHYTSTPNEVRSITDRLFRALANGVLQVEIAQEYPLREAAEAHRALESRRTTGSTILIP
ncbi:MAG TPA: zinc-binding dehydrogenase [Candidatus Binatia bacterium]|nr:zinc-binding dehydrogenase [Candidatus Binatia bacterium]